MDDLETEPALDVQRWREERLARDYERVPPRREQPATLSGIPIDDVYTPADVEGIDPARDIGLPGEYPYTRGPHASMYRGRPWTIRQVAGFGQAEDTNGRFKYLLAHGETGLSTDFDLPTLLGYDSDHEIYRREIGKIGVAVDTVVDMHALFDGIPLEDVSTSLTINAPAAVLLAMYRVVADERGIAGSRLTGTTQNDILKEYTAQNEFIFPPVPSVELVVDTMEYGAEVDAAVQPAERLRLPHPRRRLDRRAGGGAHDRRGRSATSSAPATAASIPTAWRRACRSSGTSTTTSSRRSPSCAPPAGCGRG